MNNTKNMPTATASRVSRDTGLFRIEELQQMVTEKVRVPITEERISITIELPIRDAKALNTFVRSIGGSHNTLVYPRCYKGGFRAVTEAFSSALSPLDIGVFRNWKAVEPTPYNTFVSQPYPFE